MRTSTKRSRLLLAFTILMGLSMTFVISPTQRAEAQGGAAATATHKVALIDMSYLFNEYDKFKDMREALKAEIQQKDAIAKQKQEQIITLTKQIKSGNFKPGSPDFEKLETQILNLQSQFQIFKKKAQRDFVLRETEIYKAVYLEVAEAVNQYATFYKYTCVIRFNRKQVSDDIDPRELVKRMNNQVIWFNKNADITDEVLKHLNDRYKPVQKTVRGNTTPSRQ